MTFAYIRGGGRIYWQSSFCRRRAPPPKDELIKSPRHILRGKTLKTSDCVSVRHDALAGPVIVLFRGSGIRCALSVSRTTYGKTVQEELYRFHDSTPRCVVGYERYRRQTLISKCSEWWQPIIMLGSWYVTKCIAVSVMCALLWRLWEHLGFVISVRRAIFEYWDRW